jgi:ABC-2 type transport system permease protein
MRLLRIELTRLRWRRAVMFLTALSVILPVLVWAGMAWSTRPVSDDELNRAQQEVEKFQETNKGELENCQQHPERFGNENLDEAELEQICGEMFGEPQLEWFLNRPQLGVDDAKDHGTGVATVLLGLALLIGATFAGADWSSGSMSNQLLFEPRRARVWLAKAAAVLIGTASVAALGLATFWALTWGLIENRDIAVSSDQWRDIAEAVSRAVLMAAACALVGFVVTMFLRSTVGTLGVMLAVSIGGSLLISALPIEGNGRWILPNNVFGILENGYRYYDMTAPGCLTNGGEAGCQPTLSLAEGLRFFGVLLVVGAVLSLASFRRRDVP